MACFNSSMLLKTPHRMLSGDLAKEALDHVEPRARSGREVQVTSFLRLAVSPFGRADGSML
jgi:hypothetical protein